MVKVAGCAWAAKRGFLKKVARPAGTLSACAAHRAKERAGQVGVWWIQTNIGCARRKPHQSTLYDHILSCNCLRNICHICLVDSCPQRRSAISAHIVKCLAMKTIVSIILALRALRAPDVPGFIVSDRCSVFFVSGMLFFNAFEKRISISVLLRYLLRTLYFQFFLWHVCHKGG